MKKFTFLALLITFIFHVSISFAQKKYSKFFTLIEHAHQDGNYEEALKHSQQAITLIKKDLDSLSESKDQSVYLETLMNLVHNRGVILLDIGNYEEAIHHIQQAIDIHKDIFNVENPDLATFLDNLGVAKQNLGEYSEAEKLYTKSRDIRLKLLGDRDVDYAMSINHLASLLHEMGDYEKALNGYIKSINIIKKRDGKNNMYFATFQSACASLYQEIGCLDQAEIMLKNSLNIIKKEKSEQHPEYGLALFSLATLYQAMHQPTKALPLLEESIAIIAEKLGKKHLIYANALHQLGKAQQAIGNYSKAESFYLEALRLRQSIVGTNHPDYISSLVQLALYYQLIKQYEKAESWYLQHLKASVHQIYAYFPFLSEKQKEKFYAGISDNFEKFNAFAFQRSTQNPYLLSEVFNYRLTTKAILFQSANKMRKQILDSGDKELIATYKKWTKLKDKLAKIYKPAKATRIKIFAEDIIGLETEVEKLEKQLYEKSETFKQFADKQTVSWGSIKQKLQQGEALIEVIRFRYFDIYKDKWTDSVNYAGLIALPHEQTYPMVSLITYGKDLENKHFKAYRFALKEKQTDVDSYQLFWTPFKEKIGQVKKIFFAPDGVYNQLNINVLLNPETGNYLIDETDVHLLANAKEILEIEPASSAVLQNTLPKAVLIGRPKYDSEHLQEKLSDLEGTEKEVKHIAQLLNKEQWHTEVYLGEKASESILKQSDSPTVLHIASHGFFAANSYEDPMFSSGLMLTSYRNDNQIDEDDGRLTGYEAMNLSLETTDLVVLSACETGVGNVKVGEGVYGLQRAFKIAGAKNIIISLWLADDWATQSLMKEFYQLWLAEGNRRQAFRLAQQKMKDKYAHPYYWGAFVIWGG
ncbi:CHAT domain-containing protein [Thermoflexibacter ruber]|uniref:CHAT domain-containing protein n=1 Tax=Thermoflexibacter ruber TaxID=1003 RepID=A0A1I2DPZ6_9BACT|nr:CHAT domain-containing tetratricopeptide repeat protein [Thermoflexibacter ruber]SFE82702.1 CHAT domain-containing protein [Thermoflexibacter ruber]